MQFACKKCGAMLPQSLVCGECGERLEDPFKDCRGAKMAKKGWAKPIVYDPRIGKEVESDNPALIMADLILNAATEAYKEFFWKEHGGFFEHWAEYCDSSDLSGVDGLGAIVGMDIFPRVKEG